MDKDCFTKFPNSILEAIISGGFHGMQTAVLLYIIRKTYGWGKASDTISVSKMAAETGYNSISPHGREWIEIWITMSTRC